MRHFVPALAAALAFALPAAVAQEAPAEQPRLIVAISVDQFSADLFAQYRGHFTGGLARLQQGAVFPSTYQSHAATETCPGHATIMTGVHPSRSGIVANDWFDPNLARADKKVYCAEDVTDPASSSEHPVVSARHLKVPTLGELIKAAYPGSRNVAVSAKDRSAMMMGGQTSDEAYWWDEDEAVFKTLAGRKLAPAAQAANAEAKQIIANGGPALAVPSWCAARERRIAMGEVIVGAGRFAFPPGRADGFRISPRMDAATANLALGLVEGLRLGKGPAPDLLSISFSATDYVGHVYGHEGLEMCLQLAELDQTLGALFARLDAEGIDYLAMLTADHGGIDAPERLNQQGLPEAARASRDLLPGALGRAVATSTGVTVDGPLLYGDGAGADLYFSSLIAPDDRPRVLAALRRILDGHAQIAATFTPAELANAPRHAGSSQDWSLRDRARASFDPERSGDLVVLLKRGVVAVTRPSADKLTGHGSPWDYDRRVPLLFWRRGLSSFEQPAPVEIVDIAPTLAAMIGLKVPEGAFDGRCLDLDVGPRDSCSRGTSFTSE